MSERRLLAWSIAAPILAAVMAAVALGGLALGWSLTRTIETGVRGEIALDIASIRQGEERLRIVAVAEAIDHRVAAAPATSGGLYLLADRDGDIITGNLSRMPEGVAEGDWIRFTATGSDGRPVGWLGRKQDLPQGYTLFVARRADGFWVTVQEAAPAMAVILFACLALIGIVLSRTSQRIATAVSDLNAVIVAARTGAADRRLVTARHPGELKQLGQQINALLDTIERQLANMRGLSTQAAHELATPLARVLTRLSQSSDPTVVARCREELEEALATLRALLDIAEHESEPGVDAQTLDLTTICASVCDMYEDAAADRTVSLQRKLAPALVRGEPSLLTRAVANLVDNALKVSPPGSAVTISSGVEAKTAYLSVTDEGTGIDGRSLDELLTRARASPRSPGSHGLGLRFTRAIALRHGALLKVTPGAVRGSVFTISFPNLVG